MTISPLARQFMIAGSTHLAALSAGGVIAYPSVLLQQLQANDTIVQLDLHNRSWIGSVHGIAGIPSILLPLLMQYQGRKCAFVLSCLSIITGWVFTFFAQSITTLIIGECFHGLGTNGLLAVSFLSVSEMVQPKYRNTCLVLYGTVQALGISSVGILGRYLHWRTVSIIMACPVLIALPIGCFWPQSPSWLACKGKFDECQRIFEKLRGTDEESTKELKAIVNSQKDILTIRQNSMQEFFQTISRRDFYMPALHTFILINVLYWGGGMPVIIYSTDMMIKSSGRPHPQVKLIMDCTLFIGYNIATVLVRYCSSKKVMIFSMSGSAVFMTSAAIVTYLQSIGEVAKDSDIAVYSLLGFVVFLSLGSSCIGFSIASEIMPVKHRGIGGCLYVVYTCVLHSFSLKAYPYLCVYIDVWGVFLIYAVYKTFSIFFIWMYVPETRNRMLHEIEQFYNCGHFKDNIIDESVNVPFIRTEKNIE
ncbi:facilitated trehalose transporter Tret1-like [Anticarsia gemmatalis]|uniref:facilitated trehalose transporter Tret1-like n=1 Tax=Anticarsia gemmatalis TaxID=129554 RepID=UPI003F76250B